MSKLSPIKNCTVTFVKRRPESLRLSPTSQCPCIGIVAHNVPISEGVDGFDIRKLKSAGFNAIHSIPIPTTEAKASPSKENEDLNNLVNYVVAYDVDGVSQDDLPIDPERISMSWHIKDLSKDRHLDYRSK